METFDRIHKTLLTIKMSLFLLKFFFQKINEIYEHVSSLVLGGLHKTVFFIYFFYMLFPIAY